MAVDMANDRTPEALQSMNVWMNAWMNAWYDAAIAGNYIRHPFCPDKTMLRHLDDYFRFGLSPEEAVQVCFCAKH
jgi:hypothetical protein